MLAVGSHLQPTLRARHCRARHTAAYGSVKLNSKEQQTSASIRRSFTCIYHFPCPAYFRPIRNLRPKTWLHLVVCTYLKPIRSSRKKRTLAMTSRRILTVLGVETRVGKFNLSPRFVVALFWPTITPVRAV